MPTLGLLSTHKHTHTHKRIHAWRQPHHTKRVYTRTVNCTTKTKKHGFSATNVQLMLKILASAPLCSAPNILPRCKMSLRTHARRSSETGTFLLIFYNPCIYFFPIFHIWINSLARCYKGSASNTLLPNFPIFFAKIMLTNFRPHPQIPVLRKIRNDDPNKNNQKS